MTNTFALQLGLLALVGSIAGAACTNDDGGNSSGGGGKGGAASASEKGGTSGAAGNSGAGTGAGGTVAPGAGGEGVGGLESGGEGRQVVAGVGGAGGTPACNTLANDGPLVPEEQASGTQPTPVGGTLPDGTYVLTRRQDWDGTCSCVERRKFTFSQDGAHVELVTQTDDEPATHASGDVTFANDQLTITFTCGSAEYIGVSITLGYTVIPGTPLRYQTWDTNGGHHQLETYQQE